MKFFFIILSSMVFHASIIASFNSTILSYFRFFEWIQQTSIPHIFSTAGNSKRGIFSEDRRKLLADGCIVSYKYWVFIIIFYAKVFLIIIQHIRAIDIIRSVWDESNARNGKPRANPDASKIAFRKIFCFLPTPIVIIVTGRADWVKLSFITEN